MPKRRRASARQKSHSSKRACRPIVDAKEDISVKEERLVSVLDLTFLGGFFSLNDLGALLSTTKTVAPAIKASKGWSEHFLKTRKNFDDHGDVAREIDPLSMPPRFGHVETTGWNGPHKPDVDSVDDLKLPPRPRARTTRQPDPNSYYPDRKDKKAQGHVLVKQLDCRCQWPPGLQHFNEETGVLEDLFYPANEDTGGIFAFIFSSHRTKVYIPRELPVWCEPCKTNCESFESLVDHCRTFQHQHNMIPSERRIPKEFWDPRNKPGFDKKSDFEQVKACLSYKKKIVDFLREPMDEAGQSQIQRHRQWIIASARANEFNTLKVTQQFIAKHCVDFVISNFLKVGMDSGGYARDVILNGWENFDFHGDCCAKSFFFGLFGDEEDDEEEEEDDDDFGD